MNSRQPFLTHCFALVICRHTDGKWLCVKETKNRGWWVAGGLVNPGEDFHTAALRECKEEAGININIKGILRIEYSVCGTQTARMRVIFFATSSDNQPKQISDEESECASWLSIKEIQSLSGSKPGLRGSEIIEWPTYIENGGIIAPLSFLCDEISPIVMNSSMLGNTTNNKGSNSSLGNLLVVESSNHDKLFIDSLLENDVKLVNEMLMQKHIDVNIPINQKQWTALHYAIKIKSEDLVIILLLHNADISVKTKKNRNCIHFAVQGGIKIMKALLIAISDSNSFLDIINSQDCFGNTPLHISANDLATNRIQNTNVYNLLINNGANVELKNKEGLTALDILNLKI
jgi:8-oxo-dGTP pyrophosphatase MutT (NUDIX family)